MPPQPRGHPCPAGRGFVCGSGLGTYPPVGTSGWNFHWSSSPSKYRRFMILFFSSGGMKFSMIKYLSERAAERETEREQAGGKEQERKELM